MVAKRLVSAHIIIGHLRSTAYKDVRSYRRLGHRRITHRNRQCDAAPPFMVDPCEEQNGTLDCTAPLEPKPT